MAEAPLIYLVRHGETDSNREERFAGWSAEREAGGGPAIAVSHQAPLLCTWFAAHARPRRDFREVHLGNCDVLPVRWRGKGKLEPAADSPLRIADGRPALP